MDDDDMLVVIVGDDYPEQEPGTITIKQEVLDEESEPEYFEIDDTVEDVIATVKKHGKLIPLIKTKLEPEESDDNDGYCDILDEDYVPEEGELYDNDEENSIFHRPGRRPRRDQPPRSYVQELIKTNPELETDNELLTWTLVQIMWDTKRPEPPDFAFSLNANENHYECSHCEATTDSCPAAERHYQEKHGPRYLICLACGVDFRSTTNLYKHEKRCLAADIEIVLRARALSLGRKGKSRPYLPKAKEVAMMRTVKQSTMGNITFPCRQCSAVFTTKSTLKAHEYHHSGERPYHCTHCVAAYTSASGLSRHMKTHSDEEFVCDSCGRAFKVKQALISHLDTHLPFRKYECTICDRRFAQKMALKLHVDKKHYNLPPPCACQLCPKRYPRMSVLKNHMLKEHGMVLMTRKMFFKKLPMLTNDQVEQAKVVLNSQTCIVEPARSLVSDQTEDLAYNELNRNETVVVYDESEQYETSIYYDKEEASEQKNYAGPEQEDYHVVLNNGQEEVSLTTADLEANASLAEEFFMLVKSVEESNMDEKVKYLVLRNGEFIKEEMVTGGENDVTVEVTEYDSETEVVNKDDYNTKINNANEADAELEHDNDTVNEDGNVTVEDNAPEDEIATEDKNMSKEEIITEGENLTDGDNLSEGDDVTKGRKKTEVGKKRVAAMQQDMVIRQSRRVKKKTTKMLEDAEMSKSFKVKKVTRANIVSKRHCK